MNNSIDFTGQWAGHFTYGPEYGDNIVGEKVHFGYLLTISLTDNLTEGLLTWKALVPTTKSLRLLDL